MKPKENYIDPKDAVWKRMVLAVEEWRHQPRKFNFGRREVRDFVRTYSELGLEIGNTDLYMVHIVNGIKFKYPSCCIKNFADMAFQGIPVALYYDLIGRGNKPLSEHIMCDKCFYDKTIN